MTEKTVAEPALEKISSAIADRGNIPLTTLAKDNTFVAVGIIGVEANGNIGKGRFREPMGADGGKWVHGEDLRCFFTVGLGGHHLHGSSSRRFCCPTLER
jgi:hypothetical protein